MGIETEMPMDIDAVSEFSEFEAVLEKSHAPSMVLDTQLRVLWCNEAYEQVVGETRTDLVGKTVVEAFPGSSIEQRRSLLESYEYVIKTGQSHQISTLQYDLPKAPTMTQTLYWQILNTPILDAHGEVQYILNQPTNITSLVNFDNDSYGHLLLDIEQDEFSIPDMRANKGFLELLAKERLRVNELFQQAPGFICVLAGESHRFELTNQAYLRLIGRQDVIGKTVAEVMPEIINQGFIDLLNQVYESGEPFVGSAVPVEIRRNENEAPEDVYIDFVYQPMRNDKNEVTGIFVQGYDVTQAHLMTQQIQFQAMHDPLTGLFNRRELEQRSAILEETTGTHAILYIDLDHFKIVNDRCGHQEGDKLLIQLAQAMDEIDHNGMLARVGGDEFVLLLESLVSGNAVAVAESFIQTISDHIFVCDGRQYSVTASIGIAYFGKESGLTFAHALAAADSASFLAKDKGRARVQIADLNDSDVCQQRRDMDWTNRLKKAMREDRIVLFGQSIVALDNPKVVLHREVLSRLKDESGELVAPGAFISAAERYGLIEQLDRHILSKVFQRLSEAQDQGCRLFVNVSGITLSNPKFVYFIDTLLAKYPQVSTDSVCIEITETAAVNNIRNTAEMMRKIRDRGIEFALDDFGSGVATFNYLEKLPIRYVKIDGEFIQNVTKNPVSQAIVGSIQQIAKVMNLITIAERIEEQELIEHLHSLGINLGQGYAIHRPEAL
ncbi:EAL domain-containing protein [Aliidiomarina halalkaliphila]|uniref:EAL domain-containing protein n=1 Tax=Aliidiomarina halalkaliphila TaxID=2593535 RepID=A0A552X4J3_9GAMM|nr:GGDEF and EAL domain-containing protein [Aliidiomarina halalkaliphila]TRW49925.1 EAL domain-containing protein [Aliidiomarina halalkaliphila]